MNKRHLDFDRAENIVKDFTWMLDNIEHYMSIISDEISKTDLEKNDVLHDIELSKFNAFEGYKMAKSLQEILTVRRYWKDQQELMRYIQAFQEQHKGLSMTLQKVLRSIHQKKSHAEDRIYTPRIRRDLKICQGAWPEQ